MRPHGFTRPQTSEPSTRTSNLSPRTAEPSPGTSNPNLRNPNPKTTNSSLRYLEPYPQSLETQAQNLEPKPKAMLEALPPWLQTSKLIIKLTIKKTGAEGVPGVWVGAGGGWVGVGVGRVEYRDQHLTIIQEPGLSRILSTRQM